MKSGSRVNQYQIQTFTNGAHYGCAGKRERHFNARVAELHIMGVTTWHHAGRSAINAGKQRDANVDYG